MIEFHDTPQGKRELDRISKLNILSGLEKTMLRALLTIRGHAKANYLTGPYPQKLSFVYGKGVLRSSIDVGVESAAGEIIGHIGIPEAVKYGKFWEFGIARIKHGPKQRAWLRPAIEDKKAEIFKNFEVEIVRRVNE